MRLEQAMNVGATDPGMAVLVQPNRLELPLGYESADCPDADAEQTGALGLGDG